MEEEKISKDKNMIKLKVSPHLNEEKLEQQLKQVQQFNELDISIEKIKNGNDMLEKVFNHIKYFKNITKLGLFLENFKDLECNLIFSSISELDNLEHLQINLLNDIHILSQHYNDMSFYLSKITNLHTLKLFLNSKHFYHNYSVFSLTGIYKSNSKLQDVEIDIRNIDQSYPILDILLTGIRHLDNLEKLNINAEGRFNTFQFLDSLHEETKNLSSLKDFSLYFNWQNKVSIQDFIQLGKAVSHMKNLEKLKINISLINKSYNRYSLSQFKEQMSSMKNLKFLNFHLSYCTDVNIYDIFEAFSMIPNLEDTIIDLYLNQFSSFNQDLNQFAQVLSTIPSISHLDIYFSCLIEFASQKIIDFIGKLDGLAKLKKFLINFRANDGADAEQFNFDSLAIPLKNLEKFDFSMFEKETIGQNNVNRIIDSLRHSDQLKDLKIFFTSYGKGYLTDEQRTINIRDALVNKTNITHINLNFSQRYKISSQDFSQFFNSLYKNPNLENIDFKFPDECEFDFLFLNSLSDSLKDKQNLKHLRLHFNKTSLSFDDIGLYNLSESIKNLTQLTHLSINIHKDNLSVSTITNLISGFKHLVNLTQLSFEMRSRIFSSEQDQREIANSFQFPEKILVLTIQWEEQNLKFKNIEGLFQSMQSMQTLDSMYIQFGKTIITQEECVLLKQYLSVFKSLTRIQFQFFELQLMYLTILLQELPFLKKIEFRDYEFLKSYDRVEVKRKFESNYEVSKRIQQGLQNSLEEIYQIENFRFVPSQNVSIQWSLQNLKILTHLNLILPSNQNITKQSISELFTYMQELVNLRDLKIQIKDSVPVGTKNILLLEKVMKELYQLRQLNIKIQSNCKINWDEGKHFLNGLIYLTHLQSLKIKIDDQSEQQISIFSIIKENIGSLQQLTKLQIQIFGQINEDTTIDELKQLFQKLGDQLIYLSLYFHNLNQKDRFQNNLSKILRLLKCLQYAKFVNRQKQSIKKLKRLVVTQYKYDD